MSIFGQMLREHPVPVEGQSGHAGAAAVVAQTGVDPRLGEDDIDLVLLVREKRSQYGAASSLLFVLQQSSENNVWKQGARPPAVVPSSWRGSVSTSKT